MEKPKDDIGQIGQVNILMDAGAAENIRTFILSSVGISVGLVVGMSPLFFQEIKPETRRHQDLILFSNDIARQYDGTAVCNDGIEEEFKFDHVGSYHNGDTVDTTHKPDSGPVNFHEKLIHCVVITPEGKQVVQCDELKLDTCRLQSKTF